MTKRSGDEFDETTSTGQPPLRKKRKYDSEGARRTRIENRRRALLGLPKLKRQRVMNRPYKFSGKYRGKNGKEKRKYKNHFGGIAVVPGGEKNVASKKKDAGKKAKGDRLESVVGKVSTANRRLAGVEV